MEHQWIGLVVLGVWLLMGIMANVLIIYETKKSKDSLSIKELFWGFLLGFFGPLALWFVFAASDYAFVRFVERKWDSFWDYKIIKGGK